MEGYQGGGKSEHQDTLQRAVNSVVLTSKEEHHPDDDSHWRAPSTTRRRSSNQPWLTEPRVATRQVVRVHQEIFGPEATRVVETLMTGPGGPDG